MMVAREKGFSLKDAIEHISTKELDGWLHGLPVAPQTRANFRRVVHNFFAFCAARGYCAGIRWPGLQSPRCHPRPSGFSLSNSHKLCSKPVRA